MRILDTAPVRPSHFSGMPLSAEAKALYRALGQRVARIRNEHPAEPTQAELAARTSGNLSRSAVANIETGRHRVAVHHLYILAKALETPVYDLLPPPEALEVNPSAPRGVDPSDSEATELIERMGQHRDEGMLKTEADRQ